MIAAPSKYKVAVYLAAIFVAGAVSGWVVGGRESKKSPPAIPPSQPARGFWKNSSIYQLELKPEQKTKADEIVERYARQMESIESDHRRGIAAASSNRNEELRGILTAEQLQQWDKLRKDREAAWRSRTNSWPGASNSFKGWSPGSPPWENRERGERGDHSRSNRDRRSPDRRDGTNAPAARSSTPP